MIKNKQKALLNKSYGVTDIGKTRKVNQDCFYISEAHGLYLVADGMGGHNAGEIASEMTAKHIASVFEQNGYYTDSLETERFFGSLVSEVNEMVRQAASDNPEYSGMGTTLAIACISGNVMHTCHVGDSRIYVINKDSIRQIGYDHSLVVQMLKEGKITAEEAALSNNRNILTQAIGSRDKVNPEVHSVNLNKGDRVLLCSDGLWDMVSDEDIKKVAMVYRNPEKVCNLLLKKALDAGGKDNITIVFVK